MAEEFAATRAGGRAGDVPDLREQAAPQRVVDRAAVVGIDQRQVPQLVALVDVGHAGRGELEQRHRQAVEHAEPGDRRRRRAQVVEEQVVLRCPSAARARTTATAASYSALGLIQLVCDLRLARGLQHVGLRCARGRRARLRVRPAAGSCRAASGRAGTRRCGDGAGSPSTSRFLLRFMRLQRRSCSRHAAGISESTSMRARTSSERLLSWVEVASIVCGQCARAVGARAVESADAVKPNSAGSPPTSFSDTSRL